MQRGFFTIMAAQFFSALADNALLVAALQILAEDFATDDLKPLLKLSFAAAYVVLAPFVGAFADSQPKGRVMFVCNGLKVIGCFLMLFGHNPFAAYALVGVGAAAYSPAKYGIITELLPPSQLVVANGWIEGLTVAATVFGTGVGGVLVSPSVAAWLAGIDVPFVEIANDSPGQVAIGAIATLYFIAAAINVFVPRSTVPLVPFRPNPRERLSEFLDSNKKLWKDPLGRVSLTVTTLFWGAGGTLQVVVILWAKQNLGMELSDAGKMPGFVALGVTVGAIYAARNFGLRDSVRVVPLGIAMGVMCAFMAPVTNVYLAILMMFVVGMFSGFFVVPLNALLQHRGASLMGSGQSISVQNFNENLGIVIMTGLAALFLYANGNIVFHVLVVLGVLLAVSMLIVQVMLRRMLANDPGLLDKYASH
jgi:LPLT family lysophospholipid transporter-like MFS transporter